MKASPSFCIMPVRGIASWHVTGLLKRKEAIHSWLASASDGTPVVRFFHARGKVLLVVQDWSLLGWIVFTIESDWENASTADRSSPDNNRAIPSLFHWIAMSRVFIGFMLFGLLLLTLGAAKPLQRWRSWTVWFCEGLVLRKEKPFPCSLHFSVIPGFLVRDPKKSGGLFLGECVLIYGWFRPLHHHLLVSFL